MSSRYDERRKEQPMQEQNNTSTRPTVLVDLSRYSAQEQEMFRAWCERERQVTRILDGITPGVQLTPAQEAALDAYMREVQLYRLSHYGPRGPRGSSLSMETEQERIARVAWEESIKTDEQRLKDRLQAAVYDYWQQQAALPQERTVLQCMSIEPEPEQQETNTHLDACHVSGQQDRIFAVEVLQTYDKKYHGDCIHYDLRFVVHENSSFELLQIFTTFMVINDHAYCLRDLFIGKMDPEDREDLRSAF